MSEANDREQKIRATMSAPEQEEVIQDKWQEQHYKKKPVLNEQKKFELNSKLQLALQNDLTVEVEYYDYGVYDSQKLRGKLLVTDPLTRTLQFDNKENTVVSFEDVMEVVID